MNNNKISTGSSGEFFVAAELERHGFSVAMPMANTELFDILAFNRETKKTATIQVKTTCGIKNEWVMSCKNENIIGDNIYYVLVKLNSLASPEYFIVPSEVVAKYVHYVHQEYLSTPGRGGVIHKDTTMRKFSLFDNTYKDRWDLIQ